MTVVSDYRSLLSNESWNPGGTGAGIILTYSFSTSATPYLASTNPQAAATFSAVNASEQATVQAALAQWSAVSGITFEQVTNTTGDLTFGFYNLATVSGSSGEAGLGNYPSAGTFVDPNGVPQVYSNFLPEGGDVYFDSSYQTNSSYFSDFAHVAIHEIGHAIGLKHPFDPAPTGPSYTLTDALDNGSETVMAYDGLRSSTLEPLDVGAVQYLYGTNTGATHPVTELWNQATESLTVIGSATSANTMFGSGGNDTLYSLGQHDALSGGDGNDMFYLAGRPAGVNGGDGSGFETVYTGLTYGGGVTVQGSGTAYRYIYLSAYNDYQTLVNVGQEDFTNGYYTNATGTFTAYATTYSWANNAWTSSGDTTTSALPATAATDQLALTGATGAGSPANITGSSSVGSLNLNAGYAALTGTYAASELTIGGVGAAGLTVGASGRLSVIGQAGVKQSAAQVSTGQAALTVAAGGSLQVGSLYLQGSGGLQYALTGAGGPAVTVTKSSGTTADPLNLDTATADTGIDTSTAVIGDGTMDPAVQPVSSPDPDDDADPTTTVTYTGSTDDAASTPAPAAPPTDQSAAAASLASSPTAGTLEVGTLGNAAAGVITIDPGSALSGTGAVGSAVVNNGTILALGQLAVSKGLTGTGSLQVGTGADLVLSGSLPQALSFLGATGTLDLLNPTAGTQAGTISGFQAGDTIELLSGATVTSASYVRLSGTNGVLQLFAGSTLVTSLQMSGNYDQSLFKVTNQGGYADVTVTAPDLMFDASYYLAHNPDVAAADADPYAHYMAYGWKEGRNPDAYFDTNYYLAQNPDVKASGANPLLHFELFGWKEGRQPSLVFDDAKYLAANPSIGANTDPLLQFLSTGQAAGLTAFNTGGTTASDPLVNASFYDAQLGATLVPAGDAGQQQAAYAYANGGWQKGLNPDAYFDTNYYLTQNPDVKAAGSNPLLHYELYGWKEGRDPSLLFNDKAYLASNPDVAAAGVDPLLHYVLFGQAEGRAVSLVGGTTTADPLVNATYYDAQLGATLLPAAGAAAGEAAALYAGSGWQKGLNPDAFFNTNYYLSHNPDVAAAHVDPLLHYELFGWKEGRDASAQFSTNKYLNAYADVKAANVDPLLHYVLYGQAEGRTAFSA